MLVDPWTASLCGSDITYFTGKTEPANDSLALGHRAGYRLSGGRPLIRLP